MGDFHQNGIITTLHNISKRPVEAIEAELNQFKHVRPMSLVLPSLFSELKREALSTIIDELCQVPYLDEIVIGLDRANEDEFRYALKYFSRLPQRFRVLWNEGSSLLDLDEELRDEGLAVM